MYTGELPYFKLTDNQIIYAVTFRGSRPTLPEDDQTRGLNDKIWNLLEDCWEEDPSERPTITQAMDRLVFSGLRSLD